MQLSPLALTIVNLEQYRKATGRNIYLAKLHANRATPDRQR